MMSNNSWDIEEIEDLGRQAAPSLSPQLRDRTLARCTQITRQQQRRRQQRGWALISTFAAICLLHWAAITALESNNGLPPIDNARQSARFAMTQDDYQKLLQQRAVWMSIADADLNAVPQQSR